MNTRIMEIVLKEFEFGAEPLLIIYPCVLTGNKMFRTNDITRCYSKFKNLNEFQFIKEFAEGLEKLILAFNEKYPEYKIRL